ncbi:MAG: tRNA preQ1(34) S-adenosylmethionine ribosyltransferase-isomerase QueA, partial [Planctomycetota bacterium]
MKVKAFTFPLPPERIAARPVEPRDAARLLVVGDGLAHRTVADLPEMLEPGDLLVVNNTKVRRARLYGRRATGGRVEMLFLRDLSPGLHEALVRANKRLQPGESLAMEGGVTAVLEERPEADAIWRVRIDGDLAAALEAAGHVPLPPYIKRADEVEDRDRYQTIFARDARSAAAPTAGLHFTPALLERLAERGVERTEITLHVGYGTFQPVEAEEVEEHTLHAEEFEVSEEAARAIQERKGRLIAVGTTTTRVLESLARTGGIRAASGRTDLFLYPGKEFLAIEGLLTNFHLPESSLLMLVCAFGGTERILAAYRDALEREYRFYSYGDAMLVL